MNLFMVYTMAFCLMGFWIVPLLLFSEYNTLHNMVWNIKGWQKVVPPIMMPLMAFALIHTAWAALERVKGPQGLGITKLFGGMVALSLAALSGRLPSQRDRHTFFPLCLAGRVPLGRGGVGALTRPLAARSLVPVLALFLTVVGVSLQVGFIPNWIKWNYKGFEARPAWTYFAELNDWLKGGP